MAKSREFTEYSQTVEDADGDEHTHVSRVHIVTRDTQGEVTVRGVGQVNVTPGSVLVETDRPDQYDVISASDWEKMNMTEGDGGTAPIPVDDSTAYPVDTAVDDSDSDFADDEIVPANGGGKHGR